MKLTFLGANREVTGSSTLLEIGGLKILIDAGGVQGQGGLKEFSAMHQFNTREFEFDINELDYIFLTHAHFDHILRIVLAANQNPNIKIIATEPTAKLAQLNLVDSAYLNEQECKRWNKKVKSEKFKPIYTKEEAEKIAQYIRCYDYDTEIVLNDKVSIFLRPNGHLIGSSAIEVVYKEEYFEKRLYFTGDTSGLSKRIPFTKPTKKLGKIDYIITEGTYGGKTRDKNLDFKKELYHHILETCVGQNTGILMPTFAIHKSSTLLQLLYEIFNEHKELDGIDIYLDSPLASESHKIINESRDYWDEKWIEKEKEIGNMFDWNRVKIIKDFKESASIGSNQPCLVLSASGMLGGGRIIHNHLPKFLRNEKSKVIFTGFTPKGTLAHKLLHTEKKTISLNGVQVPIKAKREMIPFSGHADQNELIEMLKTSDKQRLKKVFVVHGDDTSCIDFQNELNRHLNNVDVIVPSYKDVIKL